MKEAYTYDDVIMLPAYSELDSRSDVSLETDLKKFSLRLPIMSAPMDTVTEAKMAIWLGERGGLGILHRYCSIEDQVQMLKDVVSAKVMCGAATGVNGDAKDRADALITSGAAVICIDIAHGHSKAAGLFMDYVAKAYPHVSLMTGNICTVSAAKWAIDHGADLLRVGVGGGSVCTTREVAGVGLPQFSAVHEICDEVQDSAKVIADGGIRKSSDAAKALAAGASAVMLGGILASYPVAAGPTEAGTKSLRGMASDAALSSWKKSGYVVEGDECALSIDHSYESSFETFLDSIRTSFGYLGAVNLLAAQSRVVFRAVTHSGYIEGTAHAKGK